MKRRARPILRVVVSLLLGAIINIAVAWVATYRHQYRSQVSALISLSRTDPMRVAATQPGPIKSVPITIDLNRTLLALLHDEDQFGSREEQFTDERNDLWTKFSCGWPRLALSATVHIDRNGPTVVPPNWLMTRGASVYCVPIVPLWPGLAINTMFYAVIVWLLFTLGATPFALRRRWRIKRGLCPKCAYPVGTNARCIECGTMVRVLNATKS